MVDVVVALGIVDGDRAADSTAVVDQLGVEGLESGAVDAAVQVLDVGAVCALEGTLEVDRVDLDAADVVAVVVYPLLKDVVEDGLELGQASAAHVRDSAESIAVAVDSQAGGALRGRSRQGDETVETHLELDFMSACGG